MANGDMGFYLLWAWVAVMIFIGVGFDTARKMRLSFSNARSIFFYYNLYIGNMDHAVWTSKSMDHTLQTKTQAKRKTRASTNR